MVIRITAGHGKKSCNNTPYLGLPTQRLIASAHRSVVLQLFLHEGFPVPRALRHERPKRGGMIRRILEYDNDNGGNYFVSCPMTNRMLVATVPVLIS